ncbi:MAG: hypothetical protein Q8S73_30690 [Deltaproteobacteria bacterium]|nr:hypothetical protein [Myxococcales bacterium]MDP3218510.1 hypothetical protein [Deltaproteobacteria bacterium]
MVQCPDCKGARRLAATTPDGRAVMADCARCDGDGDVWQPLATVAP